MKEDANARESYNLTELWMPLVGQGSDNLSSTFLQTFWERGGSGKMTDSSVFVDQHQFPALENVLASSISSEFTKHFPTFNAQLKAVRKSLMKLWVEFHENPAMIVPADEADKVWTTKWFKQDIVPSGFVDLTNPRTRLRVSRFPNTPIGEQDLKAVQHACDAPVSYNVELAEAVYGSDWWKRQTKRHMPHAKFRHTVLPKMGDTTHGLFIGKEDTRGRLYEQQGGVGGVQNDKVMQSFLQWGQAKSCKPDVFWSLVTAYSTKEIGMPITETSWKDVLDSSNLSDSVDKWGYEAVNIALHCRDFVATGRTKLMLAFDQRGSGPGFEAVMEQNIEGMLLCGLVAKTDADPYARVWEMCTTLDPVLRNWALHRGVGKNLSKGGVYGAGGGIMAWHNLGLDPNLAEQQVAFDRLAEMLDVPEPFWNFDHAGSVHPDFTDVLSTSGDLLPEVDPFQLIEVMSGWTKRVGHKALHEAMPWVAPFIARVRGANQRSLQRDGSMLSWECPLRGTITNNPYVRSSIESDKLVTTHRGIKTKAWVAKVKLEYERDTSANYIHWFDSLVMKLVQLLARQRGIFIVGNHDSFRVHPSDWSALQVMWRKAFRMAVNFADFEAQCQKWDVRGPRKYKGEDGQRGKDAIMATIQDDMCPLHL